MVGTIPKVQPNEHLYLRLRLAKKVALQFYTVPGMCKDHDAQEIAQTFRTMLPLKKQNHV